MSSTTLITIFSIAEISMVALVLGTLFFLHRRKKNKSKKQAPSSTRKAQSSQLSLDALIQQQIKDSHAFADNASEENALLLNQRIAFLESELIAYSDTQNGTEQSHDYWDNLCLRLSSIIPVGSEENGAHSSNLIVPPQAKGAVNQSEQEISRLRGIIGRQHNAIDDLKQNLMGAESNLDNSAELLAQLEEIEVAHAQLNISVNALEQENTRLKQLLDSNVDSENEDQDDESNDLQEIPDFDLNNDIDKELKQAHDRIEALESANTANHLKIDTLQNEVNSLQSELDDKVQELDHLQSHEVDLSAGNGLFESSDNPDVLTKQIEDLTELLVKKSEELSTLQSYTNTSSSNESSLDDETDLSPPITKVN